MKAFASRLLLALLLTVSLGGCYPMYLESLKVRESYDEYQERRRMRRPPPSTAVDYAPPPAATAAAAAARGAGDAEVGRLLRVKFEDAAPVQTYGLADVSKRDGVLDNPLTGLLRRGGGGMSATVIRQLYDGRLLVRGQKALSGDDAGYLQLDGIVDPRDIDSDGEVLSNRVAEPRLNYYNASARAGARPAEFAELARFFQGGGNGG